MCKIKLSIIVPVYNVAQYLDRCVESILNQTIKDRMELILVDDGSRDNSPQLCDAWAKKDDRIVVIHKPNGGLSDARNAGLEIAQGEWVGFVDSDDHIEPQMYQEMIALAEENHAQVCTCSCVREDDDGKEITRYPQIDCPIVYERSDFIDHYYPVIRWNLLLNAWNKVYRRELFSNVRFPKGKIYEDAYTWLDIQDQCDKIVVSTKAYYHYIDRAGSIVNENFSTKRLFAIDYCYKYYEYFLSKNLAQQADYALEDLTMHYMQNFFAVKLRHKEGKKDLKPYEKRFAASFRAVMKNPVMCRMQKIIVWLARCCPSGAYRLCRSYFPEWLYSDMR